MKKLFLILLILTGNLRGFVKDSVMIPMRDGVRLNTNIYFPSTQYDFPRPVVLLRTPYGADNLEISLGSSVISYFTDMKRYILVIQDLRGRHESEGTDSLFREDGWGDLRDGYDTIEWLASRSWCNGRVGMIGASALGIVQYLAAGANPPHLVTCFPEVASWNMYDFAYQGGEFRQNDVTVWTTNFSNPAMLELVKRNPDYSDSMWGIVNCDTRLDSIHIPMFHLSGWFDMFAPAQIQAFYKLQYHGAEGARGNQKLIIGPWTHGTLGTASCGQVIFPPNAIMNYYTEYVVPWLDHWLKGENNGITNVPDIQLYLMGPVDTTGYWNHWYSFNYWPFDNQDSLILYLTPEGVLNEYPSDTGELVYEYDPQNPVPTIGGHNLTLQAGIYDQSRVWNREDVLTFVTPPLTHPVDIFGEVKLILFASSDRYDTDFTGKLVDIYPDGRKMLVTDGILMARHRNGFNCEDFLVPDSVYKFEINLNYTAYVVVPGHRIGLAVSSSNFPKYAVNPNTDQPVNFSTDTLVATNTIYSGESRLILPLMRHTNINEGMSTPSTVISPDGVIRIPLNNGKVPNFKLYDIGGRRVRFITTMIGDQLIIRITSSPGIYFLRAEKLLKIIKLR